MPEAAVQANRDIAALQSGTPLDVVEPDMRFHMSLIDAVGNERISRMYRSLVGEVRLWMVRVQTLNLLDTSLIHAKHQKILELIEAGEPDAAAALLDEHLGRARDRLAEAMEGQPAAG
ncbi:FCD domain-containing protein [Arthrobacter sp. YN]|uniref:FCD domain-containing protein n=1 Tax=Arthrobacter sp. YN TaxID=2020486 RepID=UPI001E5EBD8C|nr:FCD domain-containing protein [Arthrobacter sp. YN]